MHAEATCDFERRGMMGRYVWGGMKGIRSEWEGSETREEEPCSLIGGKGAGWRRRLRSCLGDRGGGEWDIGGEG